MTPIRRIFPLLLMATLAIGHWFAPAATAQVLVYRMTLEPIQSMNLDFYTGGYFVVPADGGDGSFIFTKKGKGEKAFVTTGTGTLFTGITENGVRKSVVRAGTTGTSDAKSSYMAYGSADQMTRLSTPSIYYYTEIAPKLIGEALASSTATDAATPKEIGFGGIFEWRLAWDKKQTDLANKAGNTVAETIAALETMLEDQGYNAEAPPPLTITSASALTASVNSTFTKKLTANGGSGLKTWSQDTTDPLPSWLELSPDGTLSTPTGQTTPATPTTTPEDFTIKVTDSANGSDTQKFTMTVLASGVLNITTDSQLEDATILDLYAEPLSANGGTGKITWSKDVGNWPPGMDITPDGVIGGYPTATGTYEFTVKVTDSATTPSTDTQEFTLTVTAAP